ncbi:spermatogenesis associated 2-like [Pygocentrus nattereri]|uniref:Spermatogenesis-associated protein 2 PUB-like domain-containing protein n=1 Tax=Pygocentrus nattereri TaxID=42514 RepID=A0AAR2M3V0_PYGNA|nr:spermatogenesis associated 2-like [Pygocentrus nattereri]
MSAGVKKNRGGLMEMYQANLERRIQQGDWNLVCRDEDLCKEVEGLLSKGAAQDTHSPLGLDPLSVMETSLEALPSTSGQTGLERLAKAFEVLELAALNLYLCPWRKEYRVVKMFSGMFTHWVKPGLTLHQIKELFGLLGYQHMGIGEEEELRLSSKPVHADSLLQLACAFFTARIECRLLLSCISPLGSSLEWELQLIRERKRGHSLQIARDSAKRKMESTPQSSEHETTVDLDLYTDDHLEPGQQAETNHMTAPPNLTYTPPKESQSSHGTSHSNTTSSKRENDDSTSKAKLVCVTTMTYQINPKPCLTELSPKPLKHFDYEKQVTPGSCAQISYLEQGYDLRQAQQDRMNMLSHNTQPETIQSWGKAQKNKLTKHQCMDKSAEVIFSVCHDCHYIHDFSCDDLQYCDARKHNLQTTGIIQPPQGERGVTAPPQRHTCLREKDQIYVVCNTCNKSHDCLCEEAQRCRDCGHSLQYLAEMNKEETYTLSKPMPLHQCCTETQPKFACLTCKVFHAVSCKDEQCLKKTHNVQKLKSECSSCSDPELHTLCRFCCAQYCKTCWFKNPMECKCGKPFSSPV